jgi:hypothetical protein
LTILTDLAVVSDQIAAMNSSIVRLAERIKLLSVPLATSL